MLNTGLNKKVVLITGVNNPFGIGAAAARAFVAEGAPVFVTYLPTPAPEVATDVPGEDFYRQQISKTADEVVEELRKRGGKIEACRADLAEVAVISEVFDRAEDAFGPVEILINNAAHCDPDTFTPAKDLASESRAADGMPMSSITADSHDKHFAVNSRAVALMMAQFAQRHAARGANWGRIVNISTDGSRGFGSEVSYGASKHALESYSRAAASELGAYGITVNVVSPGPVQSGYITPAAERQLAASIPLGRVGVPEDIADAIIFFASEQARWITGQLLYVGGGHVM